MSKHRSSLAILFSVVVLDLIGFGIVIPILPFYAEQYGASATVLGLLLTSYSAMQFLFSPLWGRASDRIGRKKVLILTMLGSAAGLTILGLAPNLLWLFVGRIFSGIFGANISVATAYVTDVTTEENRAKGMGLIGAAFGVGFILGPALGGILSHYGYSAPILFAAGLSLLNTVYAFFRLGDSKLEPGKSSQKPLLRYLENPYIRRLCLCNFLFTIGVTQLEAVFAFFMMDRFGYDARHVAYVLVLMAFIMVGIQGGMIKRLVLRFGEKHLLIAGALLLAGAFALIPSAHRIWVLLIPLCISSVGRGISQPSLLSLVSKGAPDEQSGAVMGVFQASASLARVVGPGFAGYMYDRAQFYPFLLASVLMVAVFGLAWAIPLHLRRTSFGGVEAGPAKLSAS